MRRLSDPLFLRLVGGAETRNEADATGGRVPDRTANAHQIAYRRGDIEYRRRPAVYCVFAGMHPKDSLGMMARALDGINRIKQVEKIHAIVASGHPTNFPITL
jgi:hypothetical protein